MTALVLHNARILTMNSAQPHAEALFVDDQRIDAIGTNSDVRTAAGDHYDTVDCGGAIVIPAFIDAHIHLLSYAASLSAVDCSPAAVRDVPALLQAISTRAVRTPPGKWIRATGYRETELVERRHPTRWELDAAAPDNPVRLIHGSGHGSVLNSAALSAAGITNETEEPSGSYISRRLEDGAIDGLLLEMNEVLDFRIPRVPWDETRAGVAEACHRLLAAGVTAVHDMGVYNDTETFETIARLRRESALSVDVVAALGSEAFLRHEWPTVWTGMVKAVVNELDGRPHPDANHLASLINQVDSHGGRICVHAVSNRACEVVADAFERSRTPARRHRLRHRVEHAALCRPAVAHRLAALNVVVVTNPGFLYADGERYLRELDAAELPYLHNPALFGAAGVTVACGSDAPVSEPKPLQSIAACVTRITGAGRRVAGPVLSLEAGLAAHTYVAAVAGGQERERGSIRPGLVADLVLLPPDFIADPKYTAAPVAVMQAGRWVVEPR